MEVRLNLDEMKRVSGRLEEIQKQLDSDFRKMNDYQNAGKGPAYDLGVIIRILKNVKGDYMYESLTSFCRVLAGLDRSLSDSIDGMKQYLNEKIIGYEKQVEDTEESLSELDQLINSYFDGSGE